MPVVVEQHDPEWAKAFESIKSALARCLDHVDYVSIEHVGSTPVPGLVANPVIDVDIIVTRGQLQAAIDALIDKGKYDHLGELGVIDCHAFTDPNPSTRYNMYVCVDGAAPTRNHLGLRDTLRSNAALRDEYARIKLALAAHATNMVDYHVGKGAVIQKILQISRLLTEEELLSIQKANAQGERYGAIKTRRLLLREFGIEDVFGYYELESSEANARYQSWPPRTHEQARQCVLDNIRNRNDVPRTLYELAVEHDGRFIGRVGARTSPIQSDRLSSDPKLHHAVHADLWFSFLPAVHGRGFATEAVSAFIDALRERLQPEATLQLEIECDPRNEASWKLAARLGFARHRLTKEAFACKGVWVDSLVYRKMVGAL